MASKPMDQQAIHDRETSPDVHEMHRQETMLAALALLLGPETDYHVRARATRRLIRLGPAVLPSLLITLDNHPEITTPPWPWWPPQYKHLSYLLTRLSQSAQVSLAGLLHHPAVSQPPGPVLWTSVIEAAASLPRADYEMFLGEGLTAPWMTVRYAAAMALANLARKCSLLASTLEMLRAHLCEDESIPVQLAASCVLLRQGDNTGIETLMRLLQSEESAEARKAAAFVLATGIESQELPALLSPTQRVLLTRLLILSLQDANEEVATHAACALGRIASSSAFTPLCALLTSPRTQVQIAALTTLEEMASRAVIRRAIQHHTLPARVAALLRAEVPEVRRQASYTLAAFGGEYAAAVLGATLLNNDHPGQIEAIEGLRLLHGVLRTHARTHVVRWLLQALLQPREEVQATALDSLTHLVWQARTHRRRKALLEITRAIALDETPVRLLASPSSWVRQRAVELLGMSDSQFYTLRARLLQLLQYDDDSGVRACIAYTLGQRGARWAIPALLQALLDVDDYVAETALNSLALLASPGDTIVVYVMKELATEDHRGKHDANHLGRSAQALLKKWRGRSVV